MNIRTVLESHEKLKRRICFLIDEIKQLRSLAEDVMDNALEGERACLAEKAIEADKKLVAEYDRYVALQERISSIIDTLDEESEIIALKCVYILHYSNERTADEMGYSVRHVSRLVHSGIDKLQEKYGETEIDNIRL